MNSGFLTKKCSICHGELDFWPLTTTAVHPWVPLNLNHFLCSGWDGRWYWTTLPVSGSELTHACRTRYVVGTIFSSGLTPVQRCVALNDHMHMIQSGNHTQLVGVRIQITTAERLKSTGKKSLPEISVAAESRRAAPRLRRTAMFRCFWLLLFSERGLGSPDAQMWNRILLRIRAARVFSVCSFVYLLVSLFGSCVFSLPNLHRNRLLLPTAAAGVTSQMKQAGNSVSSTSAFCAYWNRRHRYGRSLEPHVS